METQGAIQALSALAQETRLGIFRLLVQCGTDGRTAGSIGEALGVPPPTLSFHLQQLNHAGLITKRRASRSLIYSASIDNMNALLAYLTENCCGQGSSCVAACEPTAAASSLPRESPPPEETVRKRRRR